MPRMQHSIISKRDGWYTAFPQLYRFLNGRLAVCVPASPFSDHFAVDRRVEFVVVESRDGGATWTATDDLTIPYNWPGTNPRERYDRFADIMPDGSFFCAGSVGWEIWPVERSAEAQAQGLVVRPHQLDDDVVIVGGHKLFTQRSTDGGQTWSRRQWVIPGFSTFQTHQVHQEALLADGTILFSVLARTPAVIGAQPTCGARRTEDRPSGCIRWAATRMVPTPAKRRSWRLLRGG